MSVMVPVLSRWQVAGKSRFISFCFSGQTDAGADQQVLDGDLVSASFSLFHYKGGKLIAIDNVNNPKEHLLVRKLMDAGASPTPQQAADVAFDLNSLLPR